MTSINRDSSIFVIGGSYRWHILWSIFIYLNFSNMMIFFSSFYKFVSPLVSVMSIPTPPSLLWGWWGSSMNEEVPGVPPHQTQDLLCPQTYATVGKRRESIECPHNTGHQTKHQDCQQAGNVGDPVKEILT